MTKNKYKSAVALIIMLIVTAYGAYHWLVDDALPAITHQDVTYGNVHNTNQSESDTVSDTDIPDYAGQPYVTIDNNDVKCGGKSTKTYIHLDELDNLGRCGVTESVLGPETLPTEERQSIGMIRPSGWPTKIGNAKYDFIEGRYVFCRAHLQAFCLSGLNAEPRNLITGTHEFNAVNMWHFEEQTLDYIKRTGHHVFYRVTPIFKEDELIARGVHMECRSIEDDKLEYNVFVFNVEPGVHIDYYTGETYAE